MAETTGLRPCSAIGDDATAGWLPPISEVAAYLIARQHKLFTLHQAMFEPSQASSEGTAAASRPPRQAPGGSGSE